MTSIPASRSARAMILAPRSCPSRPGLATTTRILRPEVAMPAAYPLPRGRRRAPQPRGARADTADPGRPLGVRAAGDRQASMFAYIAGSPFVLQDIYGASPQQFSAVFTVNALGSW